MEGIKNTVSNLVSQVGSIGYTGTNAVSVDSLDSRQIILGLY